MSIEDINLSLNRKQLLQATTLEAYKNVLLDHVELDIKKLQGSMELLCLNKDFDKEVYYQKLQTGVRAKKYIEEMFKLLEKEMEEK